MELMWEALLVVLNRVERREPGIKEMAEFGQVGDKKKAGRREEKMLGYLLPPCQVSEGAVGRRA